ncbi:MAG TPA: carboxypeptidase regulatory-like domain-containing protein, partial [Kofleriaceae bacterium]
MRRYSLLVALLSGCLHSSAHTGVDGAVLGRVVIYRNGVAFYERRAKVEDGKLSIHVPRDRVDDFLKSLTVVDPTTRKPLSVSIPRKEGEDGSYLTMTLETPERKQADVLLTYVTEAPAWKPSYRIVVGDKGKVMLEGWAIVDNVSGEDWKGVLVGVGASSAMAFRYDLWSVRSIDRDLLQGEDQFAVAPPTGVSPYDASGGEVLGALDNSEIRNDVPLRKSADDKLGVSFSGATSAEGTYVVDGIDTTGTASKTAATTGGSIAGVVIDRKTGEKLVGATVVATSPALQGEQVAISDEQGNFRINGLPPGSYQTTFYYGDATTQHAGVVVKDKQVAQLTQKLDQAQSKGEVIQITGNTPIVDQSSEKSGLTIDQDYTRNLPVTGRTFSSALGAASGSSGDGYSAPPPPPPIRQGDQKLEAIAKQIAKTPKDIVIESRATSLPEARQHAEAVRNKLIDDGVPAKRIRLDPQAGGSGLRLLAVAPGGAPTSKAPPSARVGTSETPVGESHFMADRPMDVRAGSSAMVAMVHDETEGGVVYLYDPISDRGDRKFAFRSVKLTNPTADTLEPGPVTVYGDGRFIGEGITEPVPPRASVVVPFAADRQVIIEEADTEKDKIARLMTAQRGIVDVELQHRKATTYTITSRLDQPVQ